MACIHALVLLAWAPTVAAATGADVKTPMIDRATFPDLRWVPRKLVREPAYASRKVRYCIWVLGNGRKSVMTLAWDESGGTGSGCDTIYADVNFNGDLTEQGERFHWPNRAKDAKDRRPFEQYRIRDVKEAGGGKVFSFEFRNVYESDSLQYDGHYSVRWPNGGYEVGPLPNNHVVLWSADLKSASVYFYGGPAVPICNGKWAGERLGTWQVGQTACAGLVTAHLGDPPEAQLRFYGSQFPGWPEAVRDNRWGRAAYPIVLLGVLDAGGAPVEEIRFEDSCPCAGGFSPELIIPSRVRPGRHQLVVRMLRQDCVGGPADYVWPVEVANPDYGKPLADPAYAALKAACDGGDVKIVTLRRAESRGQAKGSYPAERVVPAATFDNTIDPTCRDWDPRPVNYGGDRLLWVGNKPHYHADSRALLKIDLSGLPKGAEVVGAALRLTLVSREYVQAAEGAKIEAYAVRREWNESVAPDGRSCWHGPKVTERSTPAWGAPGCDDPETDRFPTAAEGVGIGGFPAKLNPQDPSAAAARELRRLVHLDVTGLVRKWHAGMLPNHGVLLKFIGKGHVAIASSESVDWPCRPALVVAYRGGDAKPTPSPPRRQEP